MIRGRRGVDIVAFGRSAYVETGGGRGRRGVLGLVTVDSGSVQANPPASVSGSIAATLPAFSSSGSGTLTVAGSIAATLQPFSSSGAGVLTVGGTIAGSLVALSASAAGTVGTSHLRGRRNILGFVTVDSGKIQAPPGRTGSIAATLKAFSASGVGGVGTGGDAASTLPAFTAVASGSVSLVALTGTITGSLAAFTAAASGALSGTNDRGVVLTYLVLELPNAQPVGTVASNLPAFTALAAGTVSLVPVGGAIAGSLAAFTTTATGSVGSILPVSGTAAGTLAVFASSALGLTVAPGVLVLVTIVGSIYSAVTGQKITSGRLIIKPRHFIINNCNVVSANPVLVDIPASGDLSFTLSPSYGVMYSVEFDPNPSVNIPLKLKSGYFKDTWNVPSAPAIIDIATL